MVAGQTSIGSNGKENLLFPLPYLYISQDEGGSHSHSGTYNIDFLGWGASGRVFNCPYYAPVTMRCTRINVDSIFWVSVDEVNRIDGTVGYVSILFAHDDFLSRHYVGEVVNQGEIIGYTGTTGEVTGDHVHMNVANSDNPQWQQMSSGKWQLVGAVHMYNFMGVNDTVIVQGYGHNWREYSDTPGPIPPIPVPDPPIVSTKDKKYPFYIRRHRQIDIKKRIIYNNTRKENQYNVRQKRT